MTEPYTVRVAFHKVGSLQFISHLDLQRTMKSALIRAKAPLWYTEGFNPHPKMVFALPLSIGMESKCELLDIKFNEKADLGAFREALDKETTAEMPIIKAYIPSEKFTNIKYAEYTLTFSKNIESARDLFKGSVVVTKRTKSGEKEMDISPLIGRISFSGQVIKAMLCASSEDYLNPELICNVVEKNTGADTVSVMREKLLKEDKTTIFD